MNDIPIVDYGDVLGQTLLFLALVAAVVVGARTLSHALTRENAAHLLRQRAQRRRKEDQWRCWVCDMPTDCTHGVTNIITQYAHGTEISAAYIQPLCADCNSIESPRATRARGSSSI